jgi:lysophospholipase L1-like esterase
MRARLLALGVLLAPSASAQVSFTTYVSVGDSLAAGFVSGSLVETHQRNSVPALLARQAAVSGFEQPLVGEPGIPPENVLVTLSPLVIGPKAASPGPPRNLGLARPYNNLAVPGATAADALARVTDAGGFHDLILRGLGSQLQQAAVLRPTFVTLWIGNNDVLRAAVTGTAVVGVTLTPREQFRATYQTIVSALRATGARVVAANLPDVTTIPFVRTIPPVVVNPQTGQPVLVGGQTVPLLGTAGPLPAGSYVTLGAASRLAQGEGIPAALGGRGTPLPDEVVLTPSEVAVIRDHVSANNQSIREICQGAGVGVLDINALLNELATQGRVVGGVNLNAAFLTGGIFSYDGVHPNELGYAVLANEWIGAINAAGATLSPLDLSGFMGVGTRSARTSVEGAAWLAYTEDVYRGLLTAFPPLDRP